MANVPLNPGRYRRIGKYRVLAHIATGGMAAVYKAADDHGKEFALKILPPDLVAARPDKLERFRNEARSGAKLRHKNIVRLYELGEADGIYFLVLEYVDGIDLQRYIDEHGRLDAKESLRILIQATRALEYLHKRGVVHRDVKPANFLIAFRQDILTGAARPVVKLIDLGLALEGSDTEFKVTRDGTTVGTVDYLAPEQARNSRAADIRSDIYSLGCTWYHMLTGQPVFPEGGMVERLYKHLEAEPPDPRRLNPKVPEKMLAILRRMLAKKPADRYQSPSALLQDLLRLKRRRLTLPGEAGAEASPAEPPARKDPSSSTQNILAVDQASALVPAPNPEQQRAAAGQFDRAREVLTEGNFDYGIHLLLSCCRLDPTNLIYRRTLRQAQRKKFGPRRGARFGWLKSLPARGRLKAAKRGHNHLKVLEHGEEVLTHHPWDQATQMDMAEAAQALGLVQLGVWILEQAHDPQAEDVNLLRMLARLYEQCGQLTQAIALWQQVAKADPADAEAPQKVTNLAARDTMVRLKSQ
jgi:serine/threonine protein kinase